MFRARVAVIIFLVTFAGGASAESFTYDAIAGRYDDARLDAKSVYAARMQGECLVGLKEINFRKRDNFDPVAEWTNYRVISLLEQYPPCTVLIMIETARKELIRLTGAQ